MVERAASSSSLPKITVEGVATSPIKLGKKLKRLSRRESSQNFRKSDFSSSSILTSKQPVTMSLLSTLLELMGMEGYAKQGILRDVDRTLNEIDAPSCVTTMYNQQKMKILDRLVSGTQTIWDYQQRHKSATLIQSMYRTLSIRKRLNTSG